MTVNYYQVIDDPQDSKRWFLKSPTDANGQAVDPELFRVARAVDAATPLTISVRREGNPVDWTFADFDMPVIAKEPGDELASLVGDAVALYSAKVVGNSGAFYVLNALKCLRCVDESRSEFIKWLPEHGVANKVGQYRQITKLRLRREAVEGSDLFRIEGWRIALIVSERVKCAMERLKVRGVTYLPVTE